MTPVQRVLFRAFANELRRPLPVVDPINILSFGTYHAQYRPSSAATVLRDSFPGVMFDGVEGVTSSVASLPQLLPADLHDVLREHYRRGVMPVQDGFAHLQAVQELRFRAALTSQLLTPLSAARPPPVPPQVGPAPASSEPEILCDISGGVLVNVSTCRIPPSSPVRLGSRHKHSFIYRIRITNSSSEVVQLLSRHLIFTDAEHATVVVPPGSAGVLGKQPLIRPGGAFEYFSGTGLDSRVGMMEGSYTMSLPKRCLQLQVGIPETCFAVAASDLPAAQLLTSSDNA
jgi:ApaG protein